MSGWTSAIIEGAKAPLEAVVRPTRVFSQIRRGADIYGIYFTTIFYVSSWIMASMLSFTLITTTTIVRSSVHGLHIKAIILAPVNAALYSFMAPIMFAGLDTALIAAAAAFSPRDRPLYLIFPIRASSLLPYTVKTWLLAASNKLTLKTMASISPGIQGALLAVMGLLLTSMGLHKTLRIPWLNSIVAASLPLTYKIMLTMF
ncbi:MAG: hypothetical protein DSY37_04145 [Hyperthermus sp.]|nr:MAG: hypothetical protein DSY37_04145 [Hyperthermus sp.]